MSTEDASFVVAVELTAEYAANNPKAVEWLRATNAPYDEPTPDIARFLFRCDVQPVDHAIEYKRGITLRREGEAADPSFAESLPWLPLRYRERIEEKNQDAILRDESRNQYDASSEGQYQHDEPSRESFNPDEPPTAQPATNSARKKGAISLREVLAYKAPTDKKICASLGITLGDRPMILVGAFGTAKTWIMLSLAIEIAAGLPYFGNPDWTPVRPLRVFILDYELSIEIYQEKCSELCETKGIDPQSIWDNIYYYERPGFYLKDEDARVRILNETKGFDVILGDALRGATRGTDENKSEFRDHIDLLRDIAMDGNKFVCFLHHAGKDETKGFRGSSGIGDAAGHMFIVTNTTTDKRGPKRVHHEKLGNGRDLVDDFFIQTKRDGEDGKGPMRITFMTENESKKQDVEKTEKVSTDEFRDRMRQVASIVSKNKAGISQNEIIKAAKANSDTIKDVIKALVKYGSIKTQGTGTNHKYLITAAGQEWLDKGPRYAARTPGQNAPKTPNAPASPVVDDAPFTVENEPEQAHETSAKKNQSNASDENLRIVLEYIRDNSGCSKSEVKIYTGIQNARAVAARDKAQREGLISWSKEDGNVITAKGRELLPPSAPHDEPATPDTTANPTDAPKDA